MKKIIKEPLFVFLLLGGAIFALFHQVSDDTFSDNTEIVVTEGHIRVLQLRFEKLWQRSPNAKELDHLIQNHIREEVFYREAIALGLDRDDGIVRRRLRQKMEFISQNLASLDKPEEQELQSYLDAHQEDFRQATRLSFRQIYFNTDKRGRTAEADAKTLLATLKIQDADVENLGDPLMLKQQYVSETERVIQQDLGLQFLQSLREAPTGSWHGPVKSGFGLHLVRIDERIDGKPAELNDVRNAVVRDWTTLKRKQMNEIFYQSLLKRYKVKVKNIISEYRSNESTTDLSMNKAPE